MGLYRSIKKYIVDRCGSILPLTALTLPLVIGMTGFGADVSMWMMNKRDLQSAADSAAIAAAWEVANRYDEADLGDIVIEQDIDPDYNSYPEYAAYKEAMKNGFDPATGNLSIEFGEDAEGREQISVSVSQEEDLYFSFAILQQDVYTSAAAATVVIVPTGDFCMLALDGSADGAITAVGSVEVVAEACGMAMNSNSDSALDLSGFVTVDISDLHIAGDMEVSGTVDLNYETLETNASQVPDPYADLDIPDDYDAVGCDENNYRINSDETIDPGVYCGGIRITSGPTVTMNPGVYYMECGDFTANGGNIVGENVTIVLTCRDDINDTGNLDLGGNSLTNLSAPAEDDPDLQAGEEIFEGVAFYKDRNAPSGSQCNTINGTSGVTIDGAIYAPSDCFTIGGNADAASPGNDPCTRLIARTIKLHGTPHLGNDCDGSAAKDIGEVSIKLVL